MVKLFLTQVINLTDMFLASKKNLIALIIALLISIGFLWLVFTPPSIFNMLPFEIHQALTDDWKSEKVFIQIFDVCSAVIVLILSYVIIRNGFTTWGLFSDKKRTNTPNSL
jgi:hypothetical protein